MARGYPIRVGGAGPAQLARRAIGSLTARGRSVTVTSLSLGEQARERQLAEHLVHRLLQAAQDRPDRAVAGVEAVALERRRGGRRSSVSNSRPPRAASTSSARTSAAGRASV